MQVWSLAEQGEEEVNRRKREHTEGSRKANAPDWTLDLVHKALKRLGLGTTEREHLGLELRCVSAQTQGVPRENRFQVVRVMRVVLRRSRRVVAFVLNCMQAHERKSRKERADRV